MYVYILSEPGLWTVGFYDPAGKWQPESDHESTDAAGDRCNYLNGEAATQEDQDDARRFRYLRDRWAKQQNPGGDQWFLSTCYFIGKTFTEAVDHAIRRKV